MSCDERISQLRAEGWQVQAEEIRELVYTNNTRLVGWRVTLARDHQRGSAEAPFLTWAIDRALHRAGVRDAR